MNIGFVVPEFYNCGPVNVVLSLSKYLKKNNHQIKLICLRDSNLDENFLLQHKKIFSLGFFVLNKSDDYINIFSDLDVVHSHGYYPDFFVKNLMFKGKKITTIHCMFFKDYMAQYGLIKGFLGSIAHFFCLYNSNFDHIVGCSKSIDNYIKRFLFRKSITYINNGVDHEVFYPLSKGRKKIIKKNMGFSLDSRIFVYSGKLIKRKRVPELIEFFNKTSLSNDILLILGDGDEMDLCKKKSIKNKNIFLGSVDNPQNYYQISDFVISNSSAEGYPMSIIEAVSCGCYAILSEIEPHLEFIENNNNRSCLIGRFEFNSNILNSDLQFNSLSAQYMAEKYIKIYKD
ncbi:glycosyltransferase family 4 protein [Acinetobacter sp. YH12138]|uniref:glycosyltransferase family 4 protein n=1 Tax=Acinetobacter sp. YH12138 TaxID=2601122 RepID=UPI0015D19C2F|nr:glycosyltransferase family 4 protein [Acinetobacter sp. YH12138]QOW51071.1 glycosyltransferase family 4 protein [Acinetobacter sp. YH12138]